MFLEGLEWALEENSQTGEECVEHSCGKGISTAPEASHEKAEGKC